MLPGVQIQIISNDSQCDYRYAPVIGLLLLKDIDLLLGPFCTFCLAAVARYNRYYLYQKPIITSGAAANLEDKEEYYNLIRVGPMNFDIENMLLAIFQRYNWLPRQQQNLLIIYVPDDETQLHKQRDETRVTFSRLLRTTIENRFSHQHRYILRVKPYSATNKHFQSEVFRCMREEVRLVVLCADPDTVREIMIKAHELGFINGEYVFFNIDLFSSERLTSRPWYRKTDSNERNAAASVAYRALMTITLRKPNSTEYRDFSDKVKAAAKQNYSFEYPEEEVNSFVGAFHDAVLLYALAINDTLATHGLAGISNGSLITSRMKSRTFKGITGTVSINANGDRNADYSLLDMDKNTKNFTVVAHYYGNTKRYELVSGKVIDWFSKDNLPPPDVPKCGFDNSRCKKDLSEMAIYAVIVLLVLICVLSVLIGVIYRKLRLESELHAMNWRIAWSELEPTERLAARRRSMASQSSRLRERPSDSGAQRTQTFGNHQQEGEEAQPLNPTPNEQQQQDEDPAIAPKGSDVVSSNDSVETIAGVPLSQIPVAQLFAKTAYYKGNLVALKQIYLRNKRLEVNNKILMEIKRVKDLASDNIVRFIGACLDSPNECLVTEYCPKGSLQDILENDNLNLDWMFKFSLMLDICRGMIYLHHSFGSHGNLKSSNCLVDSRFSLKIADFGLHSLRGSKELKERDDSDYSSYRNKLWTAPELLRNPSTAPAEGTREGDVYSFGIIAQEIIYRKGVFYISDYDFPEPQDIIEKIRQPVGSQPPFRPSLSQELVDLDGERVQALLGIVRSCWHEDPNARPNFNAVKSRISRFNKDAESGNILDNLLKRMEQYSNNLESLVARRTDQYLEEKKKAENLLYCMLPKQVATTLMKGESVTAEWFDSVTIYFSDICGFTALSSESTPMEVVNLLNDLYTLFDRIIEQYDCYKVETIGDAYMVVSGLPGRNGNLHAREIARMSLSFLRNIFSFKIRHKPDAQLKLRIGVHSGPVCAGVVGLKMPRYCLFGDTVNTASRMESNGLPLKIHISSLTYAILEEIGGFVTTERGEVEMKGKGLQKTYWLHGENDNIVDPPTN
uniref:Guanylate cyclase n=2 Tax=Macrostomum lignano TaxID=282301 RepID=A0A1I8JDN4_9PLAT